MKTAIAVMIFAASLAATPAAAQAPTPTPEHVQQGLAEFFSSTENQKLSRCSDEAWTMIRQEQELIARAQDQHGLSPDDLTRMQTTMDECREQAENTLSDEWKALTDLLKGEDIFSSVPDDQARVMVLHDLPAILTLERIARYAEEASEKVLTDYLFDSKEQLRSHFVSLANRYNSLVDQLAPVPLPSNFERPAPLHCETTSNNLGQWSTITTDCR
jgi:hypothetical protein